MMLVSHTSISAGLTALPRFGPSPCAADEPSASATTMAERRCLCVNMVHLPVAIDRPARDGVEVLVRESVNGRDRFQLAALRDELGTSRLRVARVVPGAALQYSGTAVPTPRHAKARKRFAEHRLLQ